MSASPRSSRPPFVPVAGIVLIVDAIGALALAGIFLWVSLFPPVAAVQGRAPADQSQSGPALLFLLAGTIALWAGGRAVRGVRRGRAVGAAVAVGVVALFVWWLTATPPQELLPTVALLALIAVHALVAIVLLWWPDSATATHRPGRDGSVG